MYGPAKYALPFVRYYLAVTWHNVHYTRYYLPLKLLSIIVIIHRYNVHVISNIRVDCINYTVEGGITITASVL